MQKSILFLMNSRIFGIKKINILITSVVFNALLFIGSIFLSIYYFHLPDLWFNFFCIFVGNYLITKAFLYKMDSNCYLGFLLLFLGSFLLINVMFFEIYTFNAIVLSFSLASIFTYIFYRQIFHLIYGFNFLLWCGVYVLYRQQFLNIYIFFAIILSIVFLFSLIYAKIKISIK